MPLCCIVVPHQSVEEGSWAAAACRLQIVIAIMKIVLRSFGRFFVLSAMLITVIFFYSTKKFNKNMD